MTALQIDTEATSGSAGTWVAWGDSINRAQLDVRADSESLMLTRQAAWAASRLAAAAAELWTVGAFVRLVVAQAEDADGLGPIGGATIDELMWLASGRTSTAAACPAGSFSPLDGELGQHYRAELRSPWSIEAADDTELGRELLMRALRDTDGREHVRTDEFELVQLADGRYLVVLPGVTDL